jgi:hypothetical protein
MTKTPWSTLFLFLLALVAVAAASEETCSAEDGQCESSENTSGKFSITVVNKSHYRADLHWDDGRYGTHMAILDAESGKTRIDTQQGHSFFITRHGVKEGLYDPETDAQHRFTASFHGETFEIPETAAPSSNPCQDRFSICEQEAARGACWSSPGWMIVHCCKSCDKHLDASNLIDPKVRCSKERLNITEPAWQSGDLNKLFQSWTTDPDFKQYEPHVLSSPGGEYGGIDGPWVVTFDNFFNEKEAEALRKGGQNVGFERSTDQGKMNALGEREKCIGACERNPQVQKLTNRIEKVTNVPKKNYESFQILQYDHDQFYRSHHDSSGTEKGVSGHRILTFFLYLTDVEEGGETKFNKLDIQVKPKRGRALVSAYLLLSPLFQQVVKGSSHAIGCSVVFQFSGVAFGQE